MSFAKDRGMIATNPCEKGGRLYVADRTDKVWGEPEIASLLAVASPEITLALVLALWTGQRQGDLLRLAWSSYDGTHVRLQQSKTGRRVAMPAGAPLKALLDETERRSPVILTNSFGRPNHTAGEEIDDGRHIEPALRCPHIREVSDPFAVGSGRFEAAIEHVRSDGGDLPLTQSGRQSTPSRTRFKGLLPHQSFDPVQTTPHPFGEQIVPDTPGPVGSIARQKAGTNLRANVLIAPAALTARPCQPGIKPTPRDTERPAQPFRRPDPPVLRNETELHVDSFAK
jgi:hypothetical protein